MYRPTGLTSRVTVSRNAAYCNSADRLMRQLSGSGQVQAMMFTGAALFASLQIALDSFDALVERPLHEAILLSTSSIREPTP